MKFCTKCDSMYLIKKNENKLKYYCNRCQNSSEEEVEDICINITNKTDSYLTQEHRKNPYIHKDPSLPRLTNISCVNKSCISNNSTITSKNALILYGVTSKLNDELSALLMEQLTPILNKALDVRDTEINIVNINCGEKNILVKFNKDMNKATIEKLNKISSLDIKLTINTETIPCTLKKYNNSNEVIFINYDKINMHYLYICSNCENSWTNNV